MDIEINTIFGLAIFKIQNKNIFAINLIEFQELEIWQFHDILRKVLKTRLGALI